MKKIFIYGLFLFLIISVTACGSKKDEKKEKKKINPDDVIVETAYEGYTKWDFPSELNPTEDELKKVLYENISIPKITEETDTINEINDKIYNSFEVYINASKENRPAGSKYGNAYIYDVTYEYKKYENIIYIVIKTSYFNYRDDINKTQVSYLEYIYDIENDQELTKKDICSKYSITLTNTDLTVDSLDLFGVPLIPNDNGKFNIYYNDEIIEV